MISARPEPRASDLLPASNVESLGAILPPLLGRLDLEVPVEETKIEPRALTVAPITDGECQRLRRTRLADLPCSVA